MFLIFFSVVTIRRIVDSMINLKNQTALVTGVADNLGFGWHIAKTLQAAGAKIIISCHPRVQSILERYLEKDRYADTRQLPFNAGEFKPIAVIPCDVGSDESISNLINDTKKHSEHIDILIHSVAFSPEITRSHLEVSREAYLTAMSVSSYSLVALTRAVLPLMQGRQGAIVGLSYLASERVVPIYGGGMASAKAALECDARMLSWFLGDSAHRVNIVSAGPYASRAAKSIGDIDTMIDITAQKSPLKRSITPQEVANTVLFLCSNLASGITGEVIHVDAGYHAMA